MSSWHPRHLTREECKQIEADCYREIGMELPTFRQQLDPTWREEFGKKLAAWVKANPGKSWGLDRMIEEDWKRELKQAAEKAAKDKA